MPRIYLSINGTFENCPSWLCHQTKGFSHTTRSMDNFLNKNIPTRAKAHKDVTILAD
jgi:hypothetical protein